MNEWLLYNAFNHEFLGDHDQFIVSLKENTISGGLRWDTYVENSSWYASDKITTFCNQIGILNDSLCRKINKALVIFL